MNKLFVEKHSGKIICFLICLLALVFFYIFPTYYLVPKRATLFFVRQIFPPTEEQISKMKMQPALCYSDADCIQTGMQFKMGIKDCNSGILENRYFCDNRGCFDTFISCQSYSLGEDICVNNKCDFKDAETVYLF